MFTLQELQDDPAALLDIKEDVRSECSKFGEVTNVTLFDKEEDGVMSIRYKTVEAATACIMVGHLLNFNLFVMLTSTGSGRSHF